jgi:hypothetical protein
VGTAPEALSAMSQFPGIKAIYDDLPLDESIKRQIADLTGSGCSRSHVRLQPEAVAICPSGHGLNVLANLAVKPGTAKVLVEW